MKNGVNSSPEDTKMRDDRYTWYVALPNSLPKRYDQRTVPIYTFEYMKQVTRTSGITAMPAQFCEFRSEILTSYL